MDVLGPLLDHLFPARCVGCGAPPAALCPACLARARPAPAWPAPRPPPGLDWWVAAFAYEGPVREALARVKYRNARSAVPLLAVALLGRLREEPGRAVDVVTWPPTTAARRRHRGFDQAEHLARAVGRGLGVPVRPCLTRTTGPSQTGRPRNAAGARRSGPGWPAGCGSSWSTTSPPPAPRWRRRPPPSGRAGPAAWGRPRWPARPSEQGVRIGHRPLKPIRRRAVIRIEPRSDFRAGVVFGRSVRTRDGTHPGI